MKMLLISIILSATVITNSFGQSESPIEACEATLESADQALSRCGDLVNYQKDVIKEQTKLVVHAEKRARELEAERDSIWRNPLLWGLAGVFIGATAVVLGGQALSK